MKLSPTDRHTSCVVSPVHKGLERKLLSRRSRWLKNLGMRCDPPRTGLGVMHHLATTLKTPDNRQPRQFSLAAMFNWLKLPLSGNHHKLTSQNGEQSEVEQFTQKSNKSVTELLSFLSRLVPSWVNYVQEQGFSTWSSWQKGHRHPAKHIVSTRGGFQRASGKLVTLRCNRRNNEICHCYNL